MLIDRRAAGAAIVTCALVASCGDEAPSTPDAAVADTQPDAAPDAALDVPADPDPGPDGTADAEPDVAPELDVLPDIESDAPVGPGPHTLTVRLSGFSAWADRDLRVSLTHVTTGEPVGGAAFFPAGESPVQHGFGEVLDPTVTYHLDVFLDVDRDAACDAPPTDAVWRLVVSGAAGPQTVDVVPQTPHDPAGCTPFTDPPSGQHLLKVVGSGFEAHVGRTVHVALVDALGDVALTTAIPLTSGDFTLVWTDSVEAGADYRLDAYVDLDADGLCDFTTDLTLRQPLPTVTGSLVVGLTPAAGSAHTACDAFDPLPGLVDTTVAGSGLLAYEGKKVVFGLTLASTGAVLGKGSALVIGGGFTLDWPQLLHGGQQYLVDLLVDLDGDTYCASGTEPAWRLSTGLVLGDLALTLAADEAPASAEACATFAPPVLDPGPYALTFEGVSFSDHDGQVVHAKVLDVDGGTEVASGSVKVVSGAFSLVWQDVLVGGHTFEIAFFADVGSDGICQVGAEKAWLVGWPGAVTKDQKIVTTPPFETSAEACALFPAP